jgi:ADP-heptose:LPS heptosyltransferase
MELTASWLAGAELVVTVDTMIAHLAGAMNRPTWLLLKNDPDWRWSPDSGRSDWYPSMRIYAQGEAGDWQGVIDRVLADLRTAVAAPRKDKVQ